MFNLVFAGHLTADATFKKFEDKAVVNFNVAVNFPTGKKDSNGNYIDEVEFFQCSKWFKSTEEPKVLEHLKKGKKVIVEARRIQASIYEKEGQSKVNLSVIVDNLELC